MLFQFSRDGKSSYLLGTMHTCSIVLLPKEIRELLLKQDVFVTESRSIDDTNIVSEDSSLSSSLNCINENTDSRHDNIDSRILKLAKKALDNQPELNLKLSDLSHEDIIFKALDAVNN